MRLLILALSILSLNVHADSQCQAIESAVHAKPLVLCADEAYEIDGSVVLIRPQFAVEDKKFSLALAINNTWQALCRGLGYTSIMNSTTSAVPDDQDAVVFERSGDFVFKSKDQSSDNYITVDMIQCKK